jgi:hypothetical protein
MVTTKPVQRGAGSPDGKKEIFFLFDLFLVDNQFFRFGFMRKCREKDQGVGDYK